MYEELVAFPVREIKKLQASGILNGGILIDFSTGPAIFHLLPLSEEFSDITVLDTNESSIQELERWKNKHEEAYDWSHLPELFPELKGDSKKWLAKEDVLRSKIKRIMMCDISKENPTAPVVLEKADCLLTMYLLQPISQDKDAYCRNLKNVSSLLKVGGHLLLVGKFNAIFFSVKDKEFHILNYDEAFLRQALTDAGFTIQGFQVLKSKVRRDDVNFGNVHFLNAIKVRDVL
ncbi:indolethylamine N-methyltransferase-like [Pseudophryne corroboree]|uniref:indolethylamine N-methyltransferase-like n=1 Tax=Pseudophryne corroboree TaxID=495146 RepID=UPI003081A639